MSEEVVKIVTFPFRTGAKVINGVVGVFTPTSKTKNKNLENNEVKPFIAGHAHGQSQDYKGDTPKVSSNHTRVLEVINEDTNDNISDDKENSEDEDGKEGNVESKASTDTWLEYITRDYIIVCLYSFVAILMTYSNLSVITSHHTVPIHVALIWTFFGFLLGQCTHISEDIIVTDDEVESNYSTVGVDASMKHSSLRIDRRQSILALAQSRVMGISRRVIWPVGFWTNLEKGTNRNKLDWETQYSGEVNKYLMRRLARDISVEPLFKMRAMDVFATNEPRAEVWKDSLLQKAGLRSKPTFILNVMAPMANIIIYFEMPNWVKSFNDIEESDDDREDVKAFKRFLKGNDHYRNDRWKIFPSLVEGPLPIRIIAPSKRELTITIDDLPLTWYQVDESVNNRGETQAAILEVDLDLMSSMAVRNMAYLCRKHIAKLSVDCAMVIGQPNSKPKSKEPTANLGTWKVHKPNFDACPSMPPQSDDQLLKTSVIAR